MKSAKSPHDMTMTEAAVEITRLRAENAELRAFVALYRRHAQAAVGDANKLLPSESKK